MLDRTGQQVGPYRLLRPLGGSPFGEVYLAEQTQTRATSAIKVLKLQLPPETLHIFINEAQALKLQQAHTLRLLDLGVAGNIPFLVTDYTPNGSLRQRFPRGSRIPLVLVGNYLQQMAQALQFAHIRGLTHRNVKPENMLVWQENYILLSDFSIGIVDHLQRSVNRPEMAVNMPYMAPEQIQGRAQPASDQYALATVVYEWLCGVLPFQGTTAEIVAQKLSSNPRPLRTLVSSLPAEAEMVVLQALARDPQARFPSIEAFEQAFNQAMAGHTISQVISAPPDAAPAIAPMPILPDAAPAITPAPPVAAQVEPPILSLENKQPIEDDRTQIDERIGERVRARNNAFKEMPEQINIEDSTQVYTQKYALEETKTQISPEIGEQIRTRKDAPAQMSSANQPVHQTASPAQNASEVSGMRYNPTPAHASILPEGYQPTPQHPETAGSNTFAPARQSAKKKRSRKLSLILIILVLIILIIVGILAILKKL